MKTKEIKRRILRAVHPSDPFSDDFECLDDERECFMAHPLHYGASAGGDLKMVAYWNDLEYEDGVGVSYIAVDDLVRIVKAVLDAD